jgi:hypothetical protein
MFLVDIILVYPKKRDPPFKKNGVSINEKNSVSDWWF